MSAPAYSFRDAGLHSRLLRGLNAAGGLLRHAGFEPPSFAPERLLAAARRRSGLLDPGEDTLGEPLAVLAEALDREARLSTFGRIALRRMIVSALENRLALVDWAKRHPEVRAERIVRPWVIVGLPRTGTTLLSLLLGLDPLVRSLEQWEAASPVPPPDLASHREDPRIATSARALDQLHALNPPLRAMHPMGATLATECVTLFLFDLRSLALETQAFLPSYGRWLEQADMRHAYALHQLTLQVLQSRLPTETWSLKSPQHLWHLDALLGRYPDARVVWTHRDPLEVVPSVASLNCAMQRGLSRSTDPLAVGADWNRRLHLAVSRGLDFDRRAPAGWCCHVQYTELMADPLATLRRVYAHFGETPGPLHERRAAAWMRQRPQDTHGRHVYDPADFGYRPEALGERYAAYCQHFDVPTRR